MKDNRIDLLTKRQPKLRFKGFSEISKDKLKDISLIKGAGIDKIIKENEERVFLINYIDVYKNKQLKKIKFMESSANDYDIKKYKVEYGDILITPSSENKTDIGLSSIVDFYPKESTLYSYHLNCIRVISIKINPLWLNFYFSSPYIKKYFYEISQGITRYTLSRNDFKSINVKYPCLDEQSKIAKFLALLDKQIELYVSKLALTEKIKLFYLNNLFTSNKLPKLRFKGYNKNVIKESLKDLYELKKGEQLPNIYKNINGKYYHLNGGKNYSCKCDNFNTSQNVISISEGGESCGYISWNKEKFWAGGHLYVINLLKNYDNKYFYFLLKNYEKNIMKLRVGSSIPNIQKSDLENFKIIYSTNINEQSKIAKFLSLLDKQIECISNKIKILYKLRKFYVNCLFV